MSFELETESIVIYKPLKAANVKAVVDTDIIVPDTKPDVLSILQVNAMSSINEKFIQKDKICVSGNIDYTILYSGGDDTIEVKNINYRTPFTQQIEAEGIEEDMFNYVISNVSHVEFKIQNSRKINIKSVVSFDTGIADMISAPSVSSVITDIKIPMKKETVKSLNMSVCKENRFCVTDELKFPGIPGEINEILKNDIRLVSKEIKSMNNKIVVKGSVVTDTLYSVEGDMYHMENETPFTEVIDADGLNPEMHTEVKYSIHNTECELCTRDAENYMSFSATIDVLVKAFQENSHEIISDAYCPDYEMDIIRTNYKICNVEDTVSESFNLSEQVSLSEGMPGIVKVYNLTINPVLEESVSNSTNAVISGYLDTRLLYLSDSQNLPVYSLTKKIPFSLNINNRHISPQTRLEADITDEHSGYILKSDRDVEVRVTLKASGKIISEKAVDIISDISINSESPLKKQEQPGIVIYFADENEPLWDVAKRYNTTCEEIAQVNDIDEDTLLKKRQRLLIPKRLVI